MWRLFLVKMALARTPPSGQNPTEAQSTPTIKKGKTDGGISIDSKAMQNNSLAESPDLKRKGPKTLDDLFNAIQRSNGDLKSELIKSREDQLAKLDELRVNVSSEVKNVKDKVDNLATKVEKTSSDVNFLKRQMNEIKQTELACHMEISGVEADLISTNRQNLKKLICEVFQSFNITIDQNTIVKAYDREVKMKAATKRIIVVIFSSNESKALIMKKKREAKNNKGIFFDHSLTPYTRAVLMEAKKVAREMKEKSAFVSNGKVFIATNDGKTTRVNSIEDCSSFKKKSNNSSENSSD